MFRKCGTAGGAARVAGDAGDGNRRGGFTVGMEHTPSGCCCPASMIFCAKASTVECDQHYKWVLVCADRRGMCGETGGKRGAEGVLGFTELLSTDMRWWRWRMQGGELTKDGRTTEFFSGIVQ